MQQKRQERRRDYQPGSGSARDHSMSKRTDEQREAIDRARHEWAIMNENERAAARTGSIPHWALLEDFGGRAGRLNACWPKIVAIEEYRLFAAALWKCVMSEERF